MNALQKRDWRTEKVEIEKLDFCSGFGKRRYRNTSFLNMSLVLPAKSTKPSNL